MLITYLLSREITHELAVSASNTSKQFPYVRNYSLILNREKEVIQCISLTLLNRHTLSLASRVTIAISQMMLFVFIKLAARNQVRFTTFNRGVNDLLTFEYWAEAFKKADCRTL